jgi:hypothetical protein
MIQKYKSKHIYSNLLNIDKVFFNGTPTNPQKFSVIIVKLLADLELNIAK